MKNSFFLVIPEQQDSPELLVPYEIEAVTQWLLELPTANPNVVARLFYDFIENFNKVKMPAQQRLDVLESLRPSFIDIEDFLRSRLMTTTGFPKGENEQKIFNFLVSIEKNFTIGYWIAVRELTMRGTKWFKGKNVAISIQRTIKGLSEIVVTHYLMFLIAPEWVWMDLHSLYKLSLKTKKQATKVADATCLPSKINTPEDCYKQVLLLSLASSAGLMQKEIGPVYKYIGKICQSVRIEEHPIEAQDKQCIIIVDEDVKPYFDHSGAQIDGSVMYLNLLKLYKTTQLPDEFNSKNVDRFSIINVQNSSKKMPAILYELMQQCWKGDVCMDIPHFSDRLDRYVAIGVGPTHSLQCNSNLTNSEPLESSAKSFSDKELSCRFGKEGALSIGSLVSFRKKTEPRDKRVLAIVKRITIPTKQTEKVIFEVSAITPVFYAVRYINLSGGSGQDKQRAFLYGLKKHEREKSFIIVESFTHKNDDGLRVFMNGKHFPIILGGRKNIGLGYWQFECRKIEEQQVSEVIKKKKV